MPSEESPRHPGLLVVTRATAIAALPACVVFTFTAKLLHPDRKKTPNACFLYDSKVSKCSIKNFYIKTNRNITDDLSVLRNKHKWGSNWLITNMCVLLKACQITVDSQESQLQSKSSVCFPDFQLEAIRFPIISRRKINPDLSICSQQTAAGYLPGTEFCNRQWAIKDFL